MLCLTCSTSCFSDWFVGAEYSTNCVIGAGGGGAGLLLLWSLEKKWSRMRTIQGEIEVETKENDAYSGSVLCNIEVA